MGQNAMSATEFYILKYLWSRETPATFSEIMTHFNEEEKKEWKKQTVNTFLTRLAQKGFLNIDKSGKRAIYIPSVSRKKYYEDYAQQIIEDSYEGSLKLKEISYINSFAIAAGELKHGTIALMEEETLVFALATQDFLYEKMVSNVEEIKARGARVVAIAKEGRTEIEQVADEVIYIPPCMDEVSPVLAVIPLQIFAYYVAKERGCNIDKPKNLAKSVTVE